MRTKMTYSNRSAHEGYGAGCGDTEFYVFECPCGKGRIIEEHDNIPGFRDHSVYIDCERCRDDYEVDTSKGTRYWELIKKNVDPTS